VQRADLQETTMLFQLAASNSARFGGDAAAGSGLAQ
jgi:hypothetical protein